MTTYPGCWHAVVDFLKTAGTSTVFGLPADDLVLLAAIQESDLRLVLCRDQRNAAFMATGYALESGRPGVCVIGKGPAATNVLTGVLEASCSRAPLVVLAAGTSAERRGSAAFQELDQLAFVRPLVKWAHRVDHPGRVVAAIQQAWAIASGGVPGPVYLELPDHLLTTEIERTRPWQALPEKPVHRMPEESPALAAIQAARKPVLLVGGGARQRNGDRVIERLADRLGAAVFSTATGRGAVDESHHRFLGLSGLYLPEAAAELWKDADLVIALSSRLEETATFGWEAPPVVQVNLAAEEFSLEFDGHRVIGDVGQVAEDWLNAVSEAPDPEWQRRIAETRDAIFTDAKTTAENSTIARLLQTMDTVLPEDRILVQENGLQDMWSYIFPHLPCRAEAGSIVPSEQTSLGFGAAASGGVALAAPGRQVVAFVGDGAFTLFDADLETFAKERLGVLFVVLCNGGYGWLQSQLDQRRLDGERFSFAGGGLPSTRFDSPVQQRVLDDPARTEDVLRQALAACSDGRVSVLYVPVDLADSPPGLSEVDGDFPAVHP
ncbi:thiamine pyrophosphate-binding protein [Amycolatopsis jejuensis]|uniref:thiamine pyrophosphate-binding protein n=1 Tax=Amycolatopsis jejuensis TaxID=330084 RepID=UPI000527B2FE|nr:thiamine pyrophosphate-binding protein [Amycolatopsis jejuensis]